MAAISKQPGQILLLTVSPTSNTTYTVTDGKSCLADTYDVVVEITGTQVKKIMDLKNDNSFSIVPTLVKEGQSLRIHAKTVQGSTLIISDVSGRIIKQIRTTNTSYSNTGGLKPGLFFVKWMDGKKIQTKKFVVIQ